MSVQTPVTIRAGARADYPRRLDLPGYRLDPGSIDAYLRHVDDAIGCDARSTVLYHNLHSLYLYSRSAALRADYRGATVMLDGMPLLALARWHGHRLSRDQRVTWVDFLPALLDLAAARGYRVRHLGQSEAVQHTAMERLRERHAGLDLDGCHGYFDLEPGSADSAAVASWVASEAPDILLVGFGTPLQERWIAAWRERLAVPVVFACGAAFEYEAGVVPVPPRWLGPLGLEWTARLAGDPRRFAFRYLVEPLLLAARLPALARSTHAETAFSTEAGTSSGTGIERPAASSPRREPD